MKRSSRALHLCLILGLLACLVGVGQEQKKPKPPRKPRKPNPVLAQIEDVAGLPRVLLIGDSISMGYTIPTRKLLAGKANVHRIPTNGGPTTRGVAALTKWLGKGKWDVIHFNWGLHDLKGMKDRPHQVSPEEYEANLKKLVAQLKKTGATLIWASTTPVPEGDLKPPRSNDDVIKYNEIAAKIMAENDIQIDDLYAFALPQLKEIQRPVNVHFTGKGSAELAKQVAASIEKALPAK
jgi:acyl-CoA thioesterase-1